MTIEVNISGTPKVVATVEVNVGGFWKLVASSQVNIGGDWKQGQEVVTLTNKTLEDEPPSGNASQAIEFRADGTLWDVGSVSGPIQISSATDWVIPNDTSLVYEVRLLSGHGGTAFDTEAAAEDAWVTIDATRQWEHNRVSTGSDTGTYTFEIGLDGLESAIATGDFVITATKA